MPTTSSLAISCAEDIALLYLLHSVPTPPSSNAINDLLKHEDDYTLPLAREQGLASTLAFLANTKVDTNHIPALCLKETSGSIHVLMAVNKTTGADGYLNLLDLQRNFDELFAVLSEVSAGSSGSQRHEDCIFDAIINMCSPRILCRLRFAVKGAHAPKQSFKLIIEEAIRAVQRLTIIQWGKQLDISKLFVKRSEEVIKLADAWFKYQTATRLKQLVEGLHRLSQIGDLQSLFDLVSNCDMDPSSRRNFVNIVDKVSRYREAARYLYRTVKKFQIVRRMKSVIVDLPEEAFQRIPASNCDPDLTFTIKRITGGSRKPEIRHLCHLLKITEQQLHDQFANQTRKTLREAKIHAEVQLIYYCDGNTSSNPPRVICSSKDACFLCNVFMSTHGKMYTPRSHGRIYPGWRLPTYSTSSVIETRFTKALETQVRTSLGALLTRRSKTKYPYPNESTLLALSLSTSTLRTAAMTEILSPPSASKLPCLKEVMIPLPGEQDVVRQASSSSSGNIQSSHSPMRMTSTITQSDGNDRPQPTVSMSSQSNDEDLGDIPRIPSRVNSEIYQSPVQGTSAVSALTYDFYTHGRIEIHLERQSQEISPSSARPTTSYAYNIERLSEDESKALLIADKATVVDVDALYIGGEESFKLLEPNIVYLRAQGVVVRIRPTVENGEVLTRVVS
ncbi:hypothetical protein J1614_005547 [Plenodomus biglobosus]|nr:hypothetical protein J1614_005547 [Plenodomus biglobosus]